MTLEVHNISLVKKEPNNNINITNTCLPDGAQLQAMPSQASQVTNSQQLARAGPVGQETSQLGIRLPAGTELLARPSQASQLFHYQIIARPNQTSSQGMSQLLKNETESKLQLPDLRTRLGPANPKVGIKKLTFDKYVILSLKCNDDVLSSEANFLVFFFRFRIQFCQICRKKVFLIFDRCSDIFFRVHPAPGTIAIFVAKATPHQAI